MSNLLFKDTRAGAPIYALVKGEELKYAEGSIVSVGQPRVDMPKASTNPNLFPAVPAYRQVVDITYSIDGKNYTDAVDVTASVFPTDKTGAMTLVATECDAVVKELRATLKQSEQYLKDVPRQEKIAEQCKALIGQLDKEYNEHQMLEDRLSKLEKNLEKVVALLDKGK